MEGAGWEYVHVCIDDRSRLAYVEVLPNEQQGERHVVRIEDVSLEIVEITGRERTRRRETRS